MIKFYSVRNQYGLSYHLKFFKWSVRLFKISNNIYNNSDLDSYLSICSHGINDAVSLYYILNTITKRWDIIDYGQGEAIITMPFAKDAERKLAPLLPSSARLTFVEVHPVKFYLKELF